MSLVFRSLGFENPKAFGTGCSPRESRPVPPNRPGSWRDFGDGWRERKHVLRYGWMPRMPVLLGIIALAPEKPEQESKSFSGLRDAAHRPTICRANGKRPADPTLASAR
jgi:hypothetical protein